MSNQQQSPWVYVLGILFIMLAVVVVLVLRESKKIVRRDNDTTTITDSTETPILNTVPTATSTSTAIAGQASVDRLDIQLLESFPVAVTAVVSGNLADPCTTSGQPVVNYTASSNTFSIFIPTSRPTSPTTVCAQVIVPYTKSIPLNVRDLAAGTYTVLVGTQKATFVLDVDNSLDLDGGK